MLLLLHLAAGSKNRVYLDTIISPSYTSAIAQVIQLSGISGKGNNMMLFEFSQSNPESLTEALSTHDIIYATGFDLCILSTSYKGFGYKKQIHIWIQPDDFDNANLMILLGYIILGHPEWKEGPKSKIQLLHLLNHTSGLNTNRQADNRLDSSEDFIKLALDTKVVTPPGSRYTFNPRAVNLISAIVAKATGKPLDTYLQEELFTPMGITGMEWAHDKAGAPLVMAGLKIFPEDLAKLGVLCLQQGTWQGKSLIGKPWFERCFAAGSEMMPTSGLLWWRVPSSTTYVIDEQQLEAYAKAGVNDDFVKKMASLQGSYSRRSSFFAVLKGGFGEDWQATVNRNLAGKGIRLARREYGSFFGYNAKGNLGQYLVIYPKKNLVGVRMIAKSSVQETRRDSFNNFGDLLRHLIP